MQYQQSLYIKNNASFITFLADRYTSAFHEYKGMVEEASEHHDDPHKKRIPRILGYQEMIAYNLLFNKTWHLPRRPTIYKIKSMEIAKIHKTVRMIADLGIHCSLQGFRTTYFMKCAMSERPLEYKGGEIEFCSSPNPFKMQSIFERLIDPPRRYYFVLFSDDSCLAVRTNDGRILRYNIDISSCDCSHTTELFYALKAIFPKEHQQDVEDLIQQCREEIEVKDLNNPYGPTKRAIRLKPNGPRLYSGSTLTTIINNLACMLIGHSIANTTINSSLDVVSAAAKVGYIVTCDECDDWHKLQFLKHSPVRCTEGIIRPLLNIGVLLRLSGTCKGDLPGSCKTPLRERALTFQASLLRGAYPRAQFTLLDKLRFNAGLPDESSDKVVKKMMEYKVIDYDDYPKFRVPAHEIWERYDLTALEVAEMEEDFGSCSYMDHYHSSATDKVLGLDYGLSGQEFPDNDFPFNSFDPWQD